MGKKKGGKLRNKASNASLSNNEPTSDHDHSIEVDATDSAPESQAPTSPTTDHQQQLDHLNSEPTADISVEVEPTESSQDGVVDPVQVVHSIEGDGAAASHEVDNLPDVMADAAPNTIITDTQDVPEAIHELPADQLSPEEVIDKVEAAVEAAAQPEVEPNPVKAEQLIEDQSAQAFELTGPVSELEPTPAEVVADGPEDHTPTLSPVDPAPTSSDPAPPTPTVAPALPADSAPEPTPVPTTPSTNGHSRTPSAVSGTGIPDGRRSSVGSTGTISGLGSSSLVSGILIISALETIGASKDAKKSPALKAAVDTALAALARPGQVEPRVVFEPLRLACETKTVALMIAALDCIGKLVSYDFFVEPTGASAGAGGASGEEPDEEGEGAISGSLADQITSTVCDCFSPSTPTSSVSAASTAHDTLLLRLLSTLLSLIMSPTLAVHQSALLKAVRTVYNVFLLGRQGTVQTVAQATLGQIVGGVFGRVNVTEARQVAGLGGEGVPLSTNNSRADLATVAEEEDAAEAPTPKPLQEEGQMPVPGEVLVLDEATVDAAVDATVTATPAATEGEPTSKLAAASARAPANSVDALGMASTESILLYVCLPRHVSCSTLLTVSSDPQTVRPRPRRTRAAACDSQRPVHQGRLPRLPGAV